MQFTLIPGKQTSQQTVTPAGWIFPSAGMTDAGVLALFAQGNVFPASLGGGSFRMEPIDLNTPMVYPNGMQTFTDPSNDSAPQGWATDYQSGGASGTSTGAITASFATNFPANFSGDIAGLVAACNGASSGGIAQSIPVTKSPASSFSGVTNISCPAGKYPFTNPTSGVLACTAASAIQTNSDDALTGNPTYQANFDAGYDNTVTAVYAPMDGSGNLILYQQTQKGAPSTTPIPAGSDAAALAQVASFYQSTLGVPMPDGVTGFVNLSVWLKFRSMQCLNFPDAIFNYNSILQENNFGQYAFSPNVQVSNSTYYNIGGSAPPPAASFASFTFPTPGDETQSLIYRWSRPPFDTPIPLQNYTFSVPNIIIRK